MSWANFFHERPQSSFLHGWNEVVVQATPAEQGVCPPLGGAGFEMLIESESLAGGAEQRQKAVGLLYRGVSWRSQKYGPSRATRAPDGVVREPLGWAAGPGGVTPNVQLGGIFPAEVRSSPLPERKRRAKR